nr:MAG TPA: hypothetical protein [Caudoviricetes sp.]
MFRLKEYYNKTRVKNMSKKVEKYKLKQNS